MDKCPECGAEHPAGTRFCTQCGAPMGEASPADISIQALDTDVDHLERHFAGGRGRISYRIDGTTMQVITIELEPGEVIYSESGGMSWMTGNVEMKTHSGGGLGRVVRRAISGESLFITDFFVNTGKGTIAFASEFPGKIIPFNLQPGESIIVQKDAFMCAEKSVDMDLHFRKRLGTGFFGGEGFIMQRITGPGLAFVEVDGEVVEYDLQAGQQLKVDTGHLAAMEASVDFDVTMIKGFRNILLGGEGLFLASVRGPGKVWLQTMPMSKLAQKVAQFMPQVGGKGSSGGLNIDVGSLLGG
jgi:uncharacterized protein (TIGR00266 family)